MLISNSDSLVAQEAEVIEGLSQVLGADAKLDAIICVAGGWAGGSSANKGKSSILPLLLWITPPPLPLLSPLRFHQKLRADDSPERLELADRR